MFLSKLVMIQMDSVLDLTGENNQIILHKQYNVVILPVSSGN